MSTFKKTPSIKVSINVHDFNNLIKTLDSYTNSEIEDIKNTSVRLKDKLLRYSVPNLHEEIVEVEIRFFPSEASEIIYLFVKKNSNESTLEEINYYELLLQKREEIKKIAFENNKKI